ncbi:signal sequence receptor alpha [Niveomyces insectorum RCEF 264]|uniref:Signal recognition particle receptor subunit alpha homolog n=1 Tax=Niveomyces insectorum RCEF 264 TaxID=1081102 RepID=A0A167UKB6_9HYPO|nr:signal sequence receptor alpha [Niveomyces insectorum RCEF 264]
MLDSFEIITTSGVVLWSRNYAFVSPTVVNKFINDVFIEENSNAVTKEELAAAAGNSNSSSSSSHAPFLTDQYAVQWALAKDLGVIFVAVYKSLLHLSWIDKLVDNIKTLFVKLYGDQLTRPNTTVIECTRFDDYFDQQMNELEGVGSSGGRSDTVANDKMPRAAPPPSAPPPPPHPADSPASTPIATPTHSRPSTPGGAHASYSTSASAQASPPNKVSRRARKAHKAVTIVGAQGGTGGGGNASAYSSDEAVVRKHHKDKAAAGGGATTATKTAKKKGRKWNADGLADDDDDIQLDYSIIDASGEGVGGGSGGDKAAAVEPVDAATWGRTAQGGKFVLKDLDDEVHSILASETAAARPKGGDTSGAGNTSLLGSGLSTIGSLFRNVVGGKVLTQADLDKAMKGMEDHLLRKNVAREAAVRLCEGVEAELLGTKTGSFESINARIKSALERALTKMLTPTSSLDLLREIDAVRAPRPPAAPRPYVLSIVGVNGVGKSTNLSKICFFLLQNRYKVLVAAADTFRAGAVEQLAVHVRNLTELTARTGHGEVALYQRGYGKDAAAVAQDAVAYAAAQGFDVVLVDTAGRRHNDARLMANLATFAQRAKPDKIVMVGEALVGTDSVAQARNFNAAFGPARRTLDGFLISKCDTVGSMVGTLVSLVHATHVPILFVGVGQHYSDLRNFSVPWAVERLLSSD